MSSTVTTATVTTIVSATSVTGFASAFTLIAITLLALLLLSKELTAAGDGGWRRLGRGLDIGTLPLTAAFVLILGLRFIVD